MTARPRIGIVLAGAVAKGAFEAGALQALARADVEIVRIVAASSGALNGTLLAASVRARDVVHGTDLLAQLWRDDAGWTDIFHPSLRQLLARRAISDQQRVLALLHRRIAPVVLDDPAAIDLRLLVAPLDGVIGNVDGHPATTSEAVCDFASADFATAEGLERVFAAACASSAFPLVFAPAEVAGLGPCVDGGAVNNTPIKWALDGPLGASLDAIVVVATTVELRSGPAQPLHGFAYAGHLATMLIGERLYRDLHEAEQVNTAIGNLGALVETGVLTTAQHAQVMTALDWQGRRRISIVQIRPVDELPGTSFSGFFEPALRRAYVEAGLARGREVLAATGW